VKSLRNQLSLIITGILLSVIAWISYARFWYITSVDPDLSISEYDKKYFSDYPPLLDGINKTNIATIIILAASIALITASGYLTGKFKIICWIIQAINIIVFSMLVMAYM
jgi:hypothetical protein